VTARPAAALLPLRGCDSERVREGWRGGADPQKEHFVNGRPVSRLANQDAAAVKAEILEDKRKALAAMPAAQRK
jgi:hypothetical protein